MGSCLCVSNELFIVFHPEKQFRLFETRRNIRRGNVFGLVGGGVAKSEAANHVLARREGVN